MRVAPRTRCRRATTTANFFTALYQNGFAHLGEAFVESRLPQTANALYDTADHYTHFLYNFLGDPEMSCTRCTLGTTAVTHPASIGLGLTNVTVHVKVGGVPRAGALRLPAKGHRGVRVRHHRRQRATSPCRSARRPPGPCR